MKTRKTKNKQPYVSLVNETSDTAAWRALSHGARVLYASLKREYNPDIASPLERSHLSFAAGCGGADGLEARPDRPLVSRASVLRLHRDDGTRLPWL